VAIDHRTVIKPQTLNSKQAWHKNSKSTVHVHVRSYRTSTHSL